MECQFIIYIYEDVHESLFDAVSKPVFKIND